MASSQFATGDPLVSVILTTHDRPHLLPLALACYQHQSYPRRELFVVDDGAQFPVQEHQVAAAGGRLLRLPHRTPLGSKLNEGLRHAQGRFCLKMDDDDWYAPRFLETMLAALSDSATALCKPSLAAMSPFLFFDVAAWELRRSKDMHISGATFLFAREDWREHPFRPLPRQVDNWFLVDQIKAGVSLVRVAALEVFLQLRHRGHLWTRQPDAQLVDDYVRECALYERTPEDLLPAHALGTYRALQRDLLASGSE